MDEKKRYTEEEIENLAEQASQNAMNHYKQGLNCAESVFRGFLDLNLSDFSQDAAALASGFGGGIGATHHICGAVTGGVLCISSMKGRKNPYELESFEERADQLNNPETGIYPIHAKFIKEYILEWGALDCRDLCIEFEDQKSKERKRKCKKIIGFCAAAAARTALRD